MKPISIFIHEALKIKPNDANNEIYDETHKLWEDVNKNLNKAAGKLYAVYYGKTSSGRVIQKIVYQTYSESWKSADWKSTTKKPEWISAAYKTKEEAMAFAETNKKMVRLLGNGISELMIKVKLMIMLKQNLIFNQMIPKML